MSKTLRAGHISIAIDDRGNLASLRNLTTNCEYLSKFSLDLWQIIYPHKDDPETPIRSGDQQKAEFALKKDSLKVHYPYLVDFEGRHLDAAFSYGVRIDGDEIVFSPEIRNNSDKTLNELWFPLINGLGDLPPRVVPISMLVQRGTQWAAEAGEA